MTISKRQPLCLNFMYEHKPAGISGLPFQKALYHISLTKLQALYLVFFLMRRVISSIVSLGEDVDLLVGK